MHLSCKGYVVKPSEIYVSIQPTLINLYPNEYRQEFHYHPFAVKLDRCVGIVILLKTYLIKYVFQTKQKI